MREPLELTQTEVGATSTGSKPTAAGRRASLCKRWSAAVAIVVVAVMAALAGGAALYFRSTEVVKVVARPPLVGAVRDFLPTEYALFLRPTRGTTFTGRVRIDFKVALGVNRIRVHASRRHLNVTGWRVGVKDVDIAVVGARFADHQEFEILLKDTIIPSRHATHTLTLEFEGRYNNGPNVGFYSQTYFDTIDKQYRWMSSTKFQPTSARKAFPCFDTPNRKARFSIEIEHEGSLSAYSNMPAKSVTRVNNDTTLTVFRRTPLMSTYLVCFVICDFVNVNSTLADGNTIVRVFARRDHIQYADYSLRLAVKYMNYYEHDFEMSFHLPKIDHFAIPVYPTGATEHWGIVTYKEQILLKTDNTTDDVVKVNNIIAHELAHNYFGNILTNTEWGHVWLQEGLTTYYSMKATRATGDDEGAYEDFMTFSRDLSFKKDIISKHPLIKDVSKMDAKHAFDILVYKKGALVFQMFENVIGETATTNGIKAWLRDRQYNNTDSDEMLTYLAKESDINGVASLFKPWLTQTGYPVVQVTQTVNGHYHLTQAAMKDFKLVHNKTWDIPIVYMKGGIRHMDWLLKDMDVLTVEHSRDEPPIKFNERGIGYYQVNYPTSMWKSFYENFQLMDRYDRVNLLQDAYHLAYVGALDYGVLLEMTSRLTDSYDDPLQWKMLRKIYFLNDKLSSHVVYPLCQKYLKSLTYKAIREIAFKSDATFNERSIQSTLISWACSAGSRYCKEQVKQLYDDYIDKGIAIHPDIESIVTSLGIGFQPAEVQSDINDHLWKSIQHTDQVKYVLKTLSITADQNRIAIYLENIMNETLITEHEFIDAVFYISDNPRAYTQLWAWLDTHYGLLLERYEKSSFFLFMVPYIFRTICSTQQHIDKVYTFYTLHPPTTPKMLSIRNSYLKETASNIDWNNKYIPGIVTWLQDNVGEQ